MWFPDGPWYLIKEFWGIEKYYLAPSKEKGKIREQYALKLSEKCFTCVIHILKPTTPLALPTCLFQTCLYLIRYNDWIRVARQYSMLWDRISVLLATRCHNCLLGLVCLSDTTAGRCEECAPCRIHYALERTSQTFYQIYLANKIESLVSHPQ